MNKYVIYFMVNGNKCILEEASTMKDADKQFQEINEELVHGLVDYEEYDPNIHYTAEELLKRRSS